MKSIFTSILAIVFIASLNAQWEPTNFTDGIVNPSIELMYAAVSHEGALYGSSDGKRIQKSSDQGNSWETIPLFPYPGKITSLVSAGDRLYANKTSSFAEGTVYYTEDDGVTWETDTVGMPDHIFYAPSKSDIKEMIFCGEHLVATFDNTDAYYTKRPEDDEWVKSDFMATNDPRNYDCMNGTTLLAAADSDFYFNTDLDGDFSTPTNTNLPVYFIGDVVGASESRIFLAGKGYNSPMQEFFYSDDMGENWTSIDVSNIIGNHVFYGSQSIVEIFAQGNEVYISLDQDATESLPDVYYSDDGGITYVEFNAGLPNDAFGTNLIKAFISHESSIYALANFTDIYRNGGIINSTSITPKNHLSIYPNPTTGLIQIDNLDYEKNISIYDAWGRLLMSDVKKQIDLSAHAPGIYFARTTNGSIAKIIKK